MRALKFLVIAMGVLIVAGVGFIAITIADRSAKSLSGDAAPADVSVAIPPGSRIVETTLDGDRLALRLELADGATRVLVVDTATGREIARVNVSRAAGEAK